MLILQAEEDLSVLRIAPAALPQLDRRERGKKNLRRADLFISSRTIAAAFCKRPQAEGRKS
jgi:hypothetical protein